MAELKTPNGLVVGRIPDRLIPKEIEEKPKTDEPVAVKRGRGRKPKAKD